MPADPEHRAPGPTRPRRTQAERRAESERRLLEAALRVIGRNGTLAATMAEVGETAGYSRGLPAAVFGTKDRLIVQAANSIRERNPRSRALFAAAPGAGVADMIAMIETWFGLTKDGADEYRGMLVLLAEGLVSAITVRFPELQKELQAIDQAARARFRGFLETSRAAGELRGDVDIESEAILILGAVRGILWQWLIAPDEFDLMRVGKTFTDQLRQQLQRPR